MTHIKLQNHNPAKTYDNRKAFQSNVNCPLADRCLGYIISKFEHFWRWRGRGEFQVARGFSQVNKFEHIWGSCDLWLTNGIMDNDHIGTSAVDRQTDIQTDTHGWQHYLPTTSLAGGNNEHGGCNRFQWKMFISNVTFYSLNMEKGINKYWLRNQELYQFRSLNRLKKDCYFTKSQKSCVLNSFAWFCISICENSEHTQNILEYLMFNNVLEIVLI